MYVSQYDLSGRPFQPTADPRFYFESATHRKAMSYLGYGLAQGEGFIVITGDDGAGKSTLVAQLLATIDPQRLAAVRIQCDDLDGETLLRRTADAFGIATDGVETRHVLSRVEAYMHHQARAGRRSLLIVDEAHALTLDALDVLRQLSNFQLGGQSLAQIFLFGRTGFRDFLRGTTELEPLRQRVIASHHLEPLLAEEIQPYIEHRLKVAGWLGRPAFAREAVSLLGRASGGMPALLNSIADMALRFGSEASAERIDASIIQEACAKLGYPIDPPRVDDAASDAPEAGSEEVPVAPAEPAAPQAPDAAELEAMRAEVHSLQEAIGETTAEADAVSALAQPPIDTADKDALSHRLTRIEARLAEQDDMLRHILAKLLEWMDRDAAGGAVSHRAA